MRKMLDPKTIALIGATEAEGTVGRTIMENLMRSEGRALFPINPAHESVFDIGCLPSITAVPERVDLAVVATPASTVPDVLLECAKAGVRGAIVVSAGFGETGKEGMALERRIKRILQDHPMRVVGPNCLGVIRPSVGLNASLLHVEPKPGDIALISQSGALGTGMLDWAVSAQRRVLPLRLGRRHGRCRLRRPGGLPGRGPAHAEHPHLHGDDRERAPLHERSAQLRAQQADHRPEARPLLGKRASGARRTPAR